MYTTSTKYASHMERDRRIREAEETEHITKVPVPHIRQRKDKKGTQQNNLFYADNNTDYKTTNTMSYLSPESPTNYRERQVQIQNRRRDSTYQFGNHKEQPTSTVRSTYRHPGVNAIAQYQRSPQYQNRINAKSSSPTQNHKTQHMISRKKSPSPTQRVEVVSPNRSQASRLFKCDDNRWKRNLKSSVQSMYVPHSASPKRDHFKKRISQTKESIILGNDQVDYTKQPTGVAYIAPEVIIPYQKHIPTISTIELGDGPTVREPTSKDYAPFTTQERTRAFSEAQHYMDSTGLKKHRKFYSQVSLGTDHATKKTTTAASYQPYQFAA